MTTYSDIEKNDSMVNHSGGLSKVVTMHQNICRVQHVSRMAVFTERVCWKCQICCSNKRILFNEPRTFLVGAPKL